MSEQNIRRFPPSWRVECIEGGYVVKDANGQSLAYIYGRESGANADTAKVLTIDEARRIANNLAKLPTLLTLRQFFAFVLKILAMGALLLIAAALAAHFANRYIAN